MTGRQVVLVAVAAVLIVAGAAMSTAPVWVAIVVGCVFAAGLGGRYIVDRRRGVRWF